MTTPFDEMPTTLVTFKLDDVPEGTRMTLIESGFASLPEHLRRSSYQENSSGWDEELVDLAAYLKQPEGA